MIKQLLPAYRRMAATIGLAGLVLACAIPGLGQSEPTPNSPPQVTIASPTAGQRIEVGQEIKVQSTSIDREGIVRVELVVDSQVMRVDANAHPQPNTPFIVAQSWLPGTPGPHIIQVRVYNVANVASESIPLTVEAVSQAVVISSTATAEPSLASPTETPTPLVPANPPAPETAPVTPTPTGLPGTPTPGPTPTNTPTPGSFSPTGFEPAERFYEIWQEVGGGKSRLGYPTGPEVNGRNYAKQFFEKGLMYWWDNPDDPDYIWAIDSPRQDLKSGVRWNRFVDAWTGEDPYSCDEARRNGAFGPLRGFGQVWCQHPELQQRLGNPWEQEAGSGGRPPYSRVQLFQGGMMLYNPINSEVYVLFDQGDWQRFDY